MGRFGPRPNQKTKKWTRSYVIMKQRKTYIFENALKPRVKKCNVRPYLVGLFWPRPIWKTKKWTRLSVPSSKMFRKTWSVGPFANNSAPKFRPCDVTDYTEYWKSYIILKIKQFKSYKCITNLYKSEHELWEKNKFWKSGKANYGHWGPVTP